jgi:hypothetical protein
MTYEEARQQLTDLAGDVYCVVQFSDRYHPPGRVSSAQRVVECAYYDANIGWVYAPTWQRVIRRVRVAMGVSPPREPDASQAPGDPAEIRNEGMTECE